MAEPIEKVVVDVVSDGLFITLSIVSFAVERVGSKPSCFEWCLRQPEGEIVIGEVGQSAEYKLGQPPEPPPNQIKGLDRIVVVDFDSCVNVLVKML